MTFRKTFELKKSNPLEKRLLDFNNRNEKTIKTLSINESKIHATIL